MNMFWFLFALVFAVITTPLGLHQAYLKITQQGGGWPFIVLGGFFAVAAVQRFRIWQQKRK